MSHNEHPPALNHGELQLVFENIWFIKGTVKMPIAIPMKISRSMTVIKNPDNNELTLVNSMRLSEEGLRKLDSLGKVAHVIRLAGFHGRDDGFYKDKYQAKVYAVKGQFYSRKFEKQPIKPEDGFMQPDVWLDESTPLPIEGSQLRVIHSSNPGEAILLIDREGGILVVGDTLQNMPAADEFVNFPAKIMMGKMGFFKAYNVGPGWLQFAKPNESEVRAILDIDFDHVLPAHGDPVIGKAKEKYRPALTGPLKGATPSK